MSCDKPTALAYYDEAGGDLPRAAYALATTMLVAASAPPPPRPIEIHAAACAIARALSIADGAVPIQRDIARACVDAGLLVFGE